MTGYSPERKAAVLKKLLPPHNLSVMELSRQQEGISNVILYTWRKQVMARDEVASGNGKLPEHWSAEPKLAVVIETSALPEIELSHRTVRGKLSVVTNCSVPACREYLYSTVQVLACNQM
jgi:transposase-like protein